MSRPSSPTHDAVLAALKASPCTASDLRSYCNSRHAVTQVIYRLRNAGHDIIFTPSGNFRVEGTYHLRRLAGDLRNWSYD